MSCTTSSGTHLHMGVYGIDERHHTELQRRADDMTSLLAYLDEERLLFSVNHIFSGLTGSRNEADFEECGAMLLAPLMAMIPAITLVNLALELEFAQDRVDVERRPAPAIEKLGPSPGLSLCEDVRALRRPNGRGS